MEVFKKQIEQLLKSDAESVALAKTILKGNAIDLGAICVLIDNAVYFSKNIKMSSWHSRVFVLHSTTEIHYIEIPCCEIYMPYGIFEGIVDNHFGNTMYITSGDFYIKNGLGKNWNYEHYKTQMTK